MRSDWTELAHEVQRELYTRLFAGDPVDDYLRQVIGELSAGDRDRQLVYRTALRREAGEYRALPPHMVAARKRGARAAGELRCVIEYVITVEGPEPAGRQDNILNYEHYISTGIRPVAELVLRILQRDFDEIRRDYHQLELDPAQLGARTPHDRSGTVAGQGSLGVS